MAEARPPPAPERPKKKAKAGAGEDKFSRPHVTAAWKRVKNCDPEAGDPDYVIFVLEGGTYALKAEGNWGDCGARGPRVGRILRGPQRRRRVLLWYSVHRRASPHALRRQERPTPPSGRAAAAEGDICKDAGR
mmetsp:Transcript_6014/g.18970  ORF Transcript_6014/g.18970 Transcript_6014/m.18970 type:complete len:133 (+) Transcript_6014:375-773(+)